MLMKRAFYVILIYLTFTLSLNALAASDIPKTCKTFLLLGDDSSGISFYGHTDSIILCSVNFHSEEIHLISISRDIMLPPKNSGSATKMGTVCSLYGPLELEKSISNCFNTEIDGYFLVRLAGFAEIIDTLGGVDIDITESERVALNEGLFDLSQYSDMSKVDLAGENIHLNGNQALAYARIRKIDSDLNRMYRQQKLMRAIMENNAKHMDINDIRNVLPLLNIYIETDFETDELILILLKCFKFSENSISTHSIPCENQYSTETIDGISYIDIDYDEYSEYISNVIHR